MSRRRTRRSNKNRQVGSTSRPSVFHSSTPAYPGPPSYYADEVTDYPLYRSSSLPASASSRKTRRLRRVSAVEDVSSLGTKMFDGLTFRIFNSVLLAYGFHGALSERNSKTTVQVALNFPTQYSDISGRGLDIKNLFTFGGFTEDATPNNINKVIGYITAKLKDLSEVIAKHRNVITSNNQVIDEYLLKISDLGYKLPQYETQQSLKDKLERVTKFKFKRRVAAVGGLNVDAAWSSFCGHRESIVGAIKENLDLEYIINLKKLKYQKASSNNAYDRLKLKTGSTEDVKKANVDVLLGRVRRSLLESFISKNFFDDEGREINALNVKSVQNLLQVNRDQITRDLDVMWVSIASALRRVYKKGGTAPPTFSKGSFMGRIDGVCPYDPYSHAARIFGGKDKANSVASDLGLPYGKNETDDRSRSSPSSNITGGRRRRPRREPRDDKQNQGNPYSDGDMSDGTRIATDIVNARRYLTALRTQALNLQNIATGVSSRTSMTAQRAAEQLAAINAKIVDTQKQLNQLNNLAAQKTSLVRSLVTKSRAAITLLKTQGKQSQEQIVNLTNQLHAAKRRLQTQDQQSQEQIVNLTNQLHAAKRRLQTQDQQSQEQIADLTVQSNHLKALVSSAGEEQIGLQQEISRIEEEVAGLQEQLSVSGVGANETKQKIARLEGEIVHQREAAKSARQQVIELESAAREIEQQRTSEFGRRLQQLNEYYEEENRKADETHRRQMEELEDQIEALRKNLAQAQTNASTQDSTTTASNSTVVVEELQNKIQSLTQEVERMRLDNERRERREAERREAERREAERREREEAERREREEAERREAERREREEAERREREEAERREREEAERREAERRERERREADRGRLEENRRRNFMYSGYNLYGGGVPYGQPPPTGLFSTGFGNITNSRGKIHSHNNGLAPLRNPFSPENINSQSGIINIVRPSTSRHGVSPVVPTASRRRVRTTYNAPKALNSGSIGLGSDLPSVRGLEQSSNPLGSQSLINTPPRPSDLRRTTRTVSKTPNRAQANVPKQVFTEQKQNLGTGFHTRSNLSRNPDPLSRFFQGGNLGQQVQTAAVRHNPLQLARSDPIAASRALSNQGLPTRQFRSRPSPESFLRSSSMSQGLVGQSGTSGQYVPPSLEELEERLRNQGGTLGGYSSIHPHRSTPPPDGGFCSSTPSNSVDSREAVVITPSRNNSIQGSPLTPQQF